MAAGSCFGGVVPLLFRKKIGGFEGKEVLGTKQSSHESKNIREIRGVVTRSSSVVAGNFVAMTELRKKILTFRDLVDLPPCIGYSSVFEISETDGVPMHQAINSLCEALKSVGDSWTNNDKWMVKCRYDDVAKKDLEQVALAMLDDMIDLARERMFDSDDDEESKEGGSPPNLFGKSFNESCLDSKTISTPATPTSVLPEIINNMSTKGGMSISPPVLFPLRVQAVGKLNPIDVKRLSIHMFPLVAQQVSNPHNLMNLKIDEPNSGLEGKGDCKLTKEDSTEVGKECDMAKETQKALVTDLDKLSINKVRDPIGISDVQQRPCSDSLVRGEFELTLPPSPSMLGSVLAAESAKPTPATLETTATPPSTLSLDTAKSSTPPSPSAKLLPNSGAVAPSQSPQQSPTIAGSVKTPLLPPPPPPMSSVIVATPVLTLPMLSGNRPPPPPPPLMPTRNIAEPLSPSLLTMTSRNIPPPPPPMIARSMASMPPPPMASGNAATAPPPPPLPGTPGIIAPPPPMMSSNGSVPSPPPPIPLGKGVAPPPPPGAISLRLKSTTKLKRSTQLGNLYRLLKGKIEGSSLDGKSSQRKNNRIGTSSGGKQGMADALAEIAKRSSYFQQIEEDVKNHAKSIMEVKSTLTSFQSKDMAELIKFHKYVESHLEKLTDETQVLARFEDFPSKKLEALRMAAALYNKLDLMITTLRDWKIFSPLNQLLDKLENYFNKIKGEIDTLDRTKDEESKKFQSHKIQFDFSILLRIKELMVDVSSSCMELALKERREAKAKENEHNEPKTDSKTKGSGKLLWRAFQFAFRVYTFAGGHDDRADMLTRELAQEIETDPHH